MALVKLDVYETPQEAYLVKGLLESNGIRAMVQDGDNLYVPVFNGVSLYVDDSDLAAARRLLASRPPEPAD